MKTDTTCLAPTTGAPERPRYYPRQMITADDLSLDQEYERNRRRLHNRMLHGWGVVCGANVCPVPAPAGSTGCAFVPWQVSVCPGYVLGPYGDEILIDCCRTIDLRIGTTTVAGGDPCTPPDDPWCAPVYRQPSSTGPFWIAIRYKQVQARPVRVQPAGCDCDDSRCEYSRWRDGYDIGVLTRCPDTHQDPPAIDPTTGQPDLELLVRGRASDCPGCPDQSWVVLGKVEVDADGCVTAIDNCACRRNVMSFGGFWWACTGALTLLDAAPEGGVDLMRLEPASGPFTANITLGAGQVLPKGAVASLGAGITVTAFVQPDLDQPKAPLTFSLDAGARPGPRTLVVKADDCTVATLAGRFAVVAVP